MKTIFLLFTTILAGGCADSGNTTNDGRSANPVEDRGNAIVAEYITRNASPYRKDLIRFTIRSENEPVQEYELDVYRKQTENETLTTSLIRKPAESAGSGSLSIEIPGKETVNVTYSSARGEFRETGTEKMFFGGLSAQELLGEWTKYDYEFAGERIVDGLTRWEVAGKLKEGRRSVIESNRLVFDPHTYLPVEMHLFDRSGKKLRTYRGTHILSVADKPYVSKTEVDNHIYNTHITIDILSREYPASMDDTIFTRERLKLSAPK